MKIAVIGGGIFGTTISWKLANKGHTVDLYEKEKDILQAASGINQYRLHRGYHYPRSEETILGAKKGFESFKKEYSKCILKDTENYYCIPKENSLTSKEQFLAVCQKHELSFIEETPSVINKSSVSLSVLVEENLFDVNALRNICYEKLKQNKVNIIFKKANKDLINHYDFLIYALYANSNNFFEDRPQLQKEYQFELCEKPVLRLPENYKNQSIVVIDGPFMCLDPLGKTGFHVIGNVVHAIHATNVGEFPKVPKEFKDIINKGIIKNPKITNIEKFIESSKYFFYDTDKFVHEGSMYTIRTVPPYREHDDARPTIAELVSPKEIRVFSGKIPTCVDCAEEVYNLVKENE